MTVIEKFCRANIQNGLYGMDLYQKAFEYFRKDFSWWEDEKDTDFSVHIPGTATLQQRIMMTIVVLQAEKLNENPHREVIIQRSIGCIRTPCVTFYEGKERKVFLTGRSRRAYCIVSNRRKDCKDWIPGIKTRYHYLSQEVSDKVNKIMGQQNPAI